MPLRDIVVVLDGSASSESRLTIAIALAQQHGAFLTGFCALDLLQSKVGERRSVFPEVPLKVGGHQDGYPETDTRVAEDAERIEAAFRERLRFSALQGDWRTVSDKVSETLVRQARHADLVILGQSDPNHPPSTGRHLIEDVLLTAGRPILVVPYIGRYTTVGTNVLVGWKDTREAARALKDAIPLLAKAVSVILLEARPAAGRKSATDETTIKDVALYLTHHGINVRTEHTVLTGISASDALLSYAADFSADLLVVGGYGHSRLRELILGGVTRGLLQNMTLPLLVSH